MRKLSITGATKLLEEMGELQQVLCKLMLLEQRHSKDTKRRRELQKLIMEEIADVKAALGGVMKDSKIRVRKKRITQKSKRIVDIIEQGKIRPAVKQRKAPPLTEN